MENVNQKCSDSMVDGKQCKGPTGAGLAIPAALERVPSCKTGRESDCPCSGLDRLEADLGIHGGAPNKMFASQVADDITPAEAAAKLKARAEKKEKRNAYKAKAKQLLAAVPAPAPAASGAAALSLKRAQGSMTSRCLRSSRAQAVPSKSSPSPEPLKFEPLS